ncbi:hypothetical protein PRIPAC_85437 [Pristionchus pacificus]|uniref:Uncharacterized protein n=1 Tax=Pristionchus pacificus TaxID=54126 RepID=A0A2A6BNH6_PRIPA|nr:hypothetical protein PRIPAC_85437 [Pristionchus pacificus]|eukprot:PDM67459.1 hypothetical protein PRIPAC_48876 [Pristionchus pacificus]
MPEDNFKSLQSINYNGWLTKYQATTMVTTMHRAYDPSGTVAKRRKRNEDSERVSRSSRICLAGSPRFLSVFDPCGHPVCGACSLKLR